MDKYCEDCGVLIKNVKRNRRFCTRCQRAAQAERVKIRKAARQKEILKSTAKLASNPTAPDPAPAKKAKPRFTDLAVAVEIVEDYNRRAERAGKRQLSYGQYVAKFGL